MTKKNLLVVTFLLSSLFICSLIYAWHAIAIKTLAVSNNGYTFVLEPGSSFSRLIYELSAKKILINPRITRWYTKLTGAADNIQAGEYRIIPGMTTKNLISNLVDGKVALYAFTLVEGKTVKEAIDELQQHPKIKTVLNEDQKQEFINNEGMLYADTYHFPAGTTDLAFLKRSQAEMESYLQRAWDNKRSNITLKSPYEALILASIIEKESPHPDEYYEISGVYHRRMHKNMKLQADPTVIYALGDKFKGKLYKKQLKMDSPYNTYQVRGLPPTPIAIPSAKALDAALHPASGDTLYFVATSTGKHAFSSTLDEHNERVAEFRRYLQDVTTNK